MFKLAIANRVQGINPSATLEIDSMSKAMKSAGEPVISFAAGEPDFLTPSQALDDAKDALEVPSTHKYSNTAGDQRLREEVANETNECQKLVGSQQFTADDVVVTNGGKEAVFAIIATLLNEGDELLLPTPAWLTYEEVVRFFGAKVVPVLGQRDLSYKVTVPQLEAAWTPATKAILLNSPSNPTGAVYSEDELRAIGQWALEKGIWVISDEIYEYLIYNSLYQERKNSGFNTAPHLLEVCPELREQIVIINGVSKAYAMTGWRVGWAIGPKIVIGGIKRLKGHLSSNVNNLAQTVALSSIRKAGSDRDLMRDAFEKRSDLITSLLLEIPEFKVTQPEGAFYSFIDISEVLNTPLGQNGSKVGDSSEFAKLLLEEEKVAVVPMDAFGIENHIRLSYALSEADISEGVSRIAKFVNGQS
jgi:aspartate/methionine/tyrosine aminotransferase